MGSGKRRHTRRRNAAKQGAKFKTDDAVQIGSLNPFPICSVPSSIPVRYRHVVENLSSHVALHRAISCSALSNMINDDKRIATELIGSGLLPVVLPMLLDADPNVAVHAAGLLRNLAVADGSAFAAAIRVFDAFDKIVAVVINGEGQPRSASWTLEVLAVIACLTEHDDLGESRAVSDGSIWNLASFLSISAESAVSVLEVFRNVVDDRPDLAQALVDKQAAGVQAQLSHSCILVRAHAAALLASIARQLPSTSETLLSLVAPHLLECASVDMTAAMRALIQDGRQARAEIDAEHERQRAAHTGETIFQESIGGRLAPEARDHAWRALFQQFRERILSVQIAAETVANLTCVDPDDRSWDLRRVAGMISVDHLIPSLTARIQTVFDEDRLDTNDWDRVVDLMYETIERCIESMINLVLNEVISGTDLIDLVLGVVEREWFQPKWRTSLLEVSGRLLALLLSSSSSPKVLHPNQLQMLVGLSRSPIEAVRQEFVAVLARFGAQSPSNGDAIADVVCERLQDESLSVFLETVSGLIDMF